MFVMQKPQWLEEKISFNLRENNIEKEVVSEAFEKL